MCVLDNGFDKMAEWQVDMLKSAHQ